MIPHQAETGQTHLQPLAKKLIGARLAMTEARPTTPAAQPSATSNYRAEQYWA